MKSLILCFLIFVSFAFGNDEEIAIKLVKSAIVEIEKNATLALQDIQNGKYQIEDIYVFVYDENGVMLARHFKPQLIGIALEDTPDAKGKYFRAEIIQNGLKGGGWTEYLYQKPNSQGLYKKKAYSNLALYNGKRYIVVAGIYAKKGNSW